MTLQHQLYILRGEIGDLPDDDKKNVLAIAEQLRKFLEAATKNTDEPTVDTALSLVYVELAVDREAKQALAWRESQANSPGMNTESE